VVWWLGPQITNYGLLTGEASAVRCRPSFQTISGVGGARAAIQRFEGLRLSIHLTTTTRLATAISQKQRVTALGPLLAPIRPGAAALPWRFEQLLQMTR
jgi:hypothetical protein